MRASFFVHSVAFRLVTSVPLVPDLHPPTQQARLPSWWWIEHYIVDNYIGRTCSPVLPVPCKAECATAAATTEPVLRASLPSLTYRTYKILHEYPLRPLPLMPGGW